MRIRRIIVERHETGESYAAIARDLGMPYITVRKVYQHYQQTGQLGASYERCRQTGVRSPEAIYQKAIALKQAHSGWGAGLIWVELADIFEEKDLPSVRTIQRWFHRAGVVKRVRATVRKVVVQRGVEPHEIWALDAKEQIRLGDGSYASWLTISDEGSGAILSVTLFPPQTLDTDQPASGHDSPTSRHDDLGKAKRHTHG